MRALLVVVLAGVASVVTAADTKPLRETPHFQFLGAAASTDALNMDCKGKPPFEVIECDFLQISIHRDDDAAFMRERAKLQKQLEQTSEADLLKEVASGRAFAAKARVVMKEASPVPERDAFMKWTIGFLEAAAACTSKPCIVKGMLKQQDESRNTCKVSTNTFSGEFQRVGPHKWVSSPGPQGACNVVTVQTLENSEEYLMLWTFTATTVTVDNDEPCTKMVQLNKPLVFTWRNAFSILRMECQFVEFAVF